MVDGCLSGYDGALVLGGHNGEHRIRALVNELKVGINLALTAHRAWPKGASLPPN